MEGVAVSGRNITGCLAFFDHDTLSWKTPQLFSDAECYEFSETCPSSGLMRNGKLYSRPTLGCLTVENESSLLPTPTKSFGVNARGWGLSRSGRLRYSQQVQDNALRFGYKPPIDLLEWMMGFPANHTAIELQQLAMRSSQRQQNGSLLSSLSTIENKGVIATATGLNLEGANLTYEDCEELLLYSVQATSTWQWFIGDIINYSEKVYGESYKSAMELTGKPYGTLRNASWVAGEYELSLRSDNLSWSHHKIAASIDDKEQRSELLAKCEQEGWTAAKLREAVRELRGEKPADEPEDEDEDDDWFVFQARQFFDNCPAELRQIIYERWGEWLGGGS